MINDPAALHALTDGIVSLLQKNGLDEAVVQEFIRERWIDVLSDNIYSCLIVPFSALVDDSGKVSDPLIDQLANLATQADLMFIADRPISIEPGLGLVFDLSTDKDKQQGDLTRQLQQHIRTRGYHPLRIAMISPSLGGSVATALKELRGKSMPVFVARFPESHLDLAVDGWLPIVSDSAQLLSGPEAVQRVVGSLPFAPRINVLETADLLGKDSGSDGLLSRMVEIASRASTNLESGRASLCAQFPHLSDIDIFDHRSGAVYFDPESWRKIVRGGLRDEPIVHYFRQRLVGYWQQSHPCYARILYTPTKVLLRGEAYYVHMKNIAPTDRLRAMCKEIAEVRRASISLGHVESPTLHPELWKVCLGLLDHVRNIGLLIFSFAHAADRMLAEAKGQPGADDASISKMQAQVTHLFDEGDIHVHKLVTQALHSYYNWLLGKLDQSLNMLSATLNCFDGMNESINALCDALDKWFRGQERFVSDRSVSELVRRWREADHPGDNLLLAHIAMSDLRSREGTVAAVGIGWGGIELPLVLQFLAEAEGRSVSPYVASWSHYRNELGPVKWIPIQNCDTREFRPGEVNVLMDDNVLTGTTLEKIRNAMHLAGATSVSMYVTRFSGERRLAHMRMERHGVIDPDFMLNHVGGFFAETAFSRSWSTKKGEYTSQIGVFSLGRRRILECIYNNSTVEAWDREGF